MCVLCAVCVCEAWLDARLPMCVCACVCDRQAEAEANPYARQLWQLLQLHVQLIYATRRPQRGSMPCSMLFWTTRERDSATRRQREREGVRERGSEKERGGSGSASGKQRQSGRPAASATDRVGVRERK